MFRRYGLLILLLLSALLLTACATKADTTPEQAALATGLSIDGAVLSGEPTFIDVEQDGTAMQLIARKDDAGNVRLAFNTCQSCGGSPYAWFEDLGDGTLQCQNCGLMCEIIRSENGGDLTYFLQYYLELLVRALDVRDERQRKREQKARERKQEAQRKEWEMARKPLTPFVQPYEEDIKWENPDDAEGIPLPNPPASTEDEPVDAENIDTADPDSPFVNTRSRVLPPVSLMEPESFQQALSKLNHSRYPIIRDMPNKVSRMIETGVFRFSVGQWAEMHSMDHKNADYECRYMYEKGWMSREKEGRYYVYSLRITMPQQEVLTDDSASPPVERSEDKGPPGDEYFQTMMDRMLNSRSDHVRRTAETIQLMISNGVTSFTRQEWMEQTGMSMVIRPSLEPPPRSLTDIAMVGASLNAQPSRMPLLFLTDQPSHKPEKPPDPGFRPARTASPPPVQSMTRGG